MNRFKLSFPENLDALRIKTKNRLIQQSMPFNKNGNWRIKIDKCRNKRNIPEIEIDWNNPVGQERSGG